jgi:choline dehydrogenase-like flavoprotein
MDHNYRGHINADFEGFPDQYYYGRRPTGVYIPRYRNVGNDHQSAYIRGFAFAAEASRRTGNAQTGIGAAYKDSLTDAGVWDIWMNGMGECLPDHANKVSLSADKKDQWGIPLLEIDCEYRQNELTMLKDILTSGAEMLEKAGFKNIDAYDSLQAPGQGIHEMGTARMGKDPKTSILNSHNQVWAAKNVFVTDGASMASSACQNPSLTYMALTARATDFAVEELKKHNL